MKKYQGFFHAVLIGMVLLVMTACSVNSEESSEEMSESSDISEEASNETNEEATTNTTDETSGTQDDGERVTIQIAVHWDEDMFNERFKDHVEEALPHIELEHYQISTQNREDMEAMFAQGTSPDIFFEVSVRDMIYYGIDYDLSEMIEKHNYDMSQVRSVFIDSIRAQDQENRLLALPYEIIYHALFYNRDIFDAFGEPYPGEMTWNEAIDLGRRMTTEQDGVDYRGLDIGNTSIPMWQLSVNQTDPDTGEVQLLDQPEFLQYVNLMEQWTDTYPHSEEDPPFNPGRFTEEYSTAMWVEFIQGLNWWKDNEGLNEDVAPLPYWEEHPRIGPRSDPNIIWLSVSPHSEHKDEAFEVISYFTSPEYQIWASRNGIGVVGDDDEIVAEFFDDYENTHDKDVPATFVNEPAAPPERISPWDDYVHIDIHEYVQSEMDALEFLRITEEEAQQEVNDAMAQQ